MNLKKIINKQKTEARKVVAKLKVSGENYILHKESLFLRYDFEKVKDLDELIKVIHAHRHGNCPISKCKKCKALLEDTEVEILPCYGNLISILEKNALREREEVERKRLPTQNDLLRWALKDAVLAYYQGLGFPENISIVDNKFDDRLIAQLAPDFSSIYSIWLQKLDELKRRGDKHALNIEEFDEAEKDMLDGMRGSAFEKRLDRYREEFMRQIWQEFSIAQ